MASESHADLSRNAFTIHDDRLARGSPSTVQAAGMDACIDNGSSAYKVVALLCQ
jgi:hypothetical protein